MLIPDYIAIRVLVVFALRAGLERFPRGKRSISPDPPRDRRSEKAAVGRCAQGFGMAAFAFRCPNTRLIVEGWIADDPTGDKSDTYECVICPKPLSFFSDRAVAPVRLTQ